MPKSDFNNFIEITLQHWCSPVNLLHIFKTSFSRSTSWWLLLSNFIEITLRYGCSLVNLLHIFRIPFTKNTFGWLILINDKVFSEAEYHPISKDYLDVVMSLKLSLQSWVHKWTKLNRVSQLQATIPTDLLLYYIENWVKGDQKRLERPSYGKGIPPCVVQFWNSLHTR